MDIRRLLQFRTVVEAGGLNAAAPLLHLSSGALSKSIQKLEGELGDALFDRSGRTLELTDYGRRIYARSERLLSEYRSFLRAAETEDAMPPAVRLATFEPFSTYVLGALVEAQPDLAARDWRVLDVGVGEIERAIRDGEADLGVTYAPAPRRGVAFQRLVRTGFGIYGRPDAFAGVPPADYVYAAPVTRLAMNAEALLAADGWPSTFLPRRVRYRLTSLESALELARRGRCAIHLPHFIARLHDRQAPASGRLVGLPPPSGYRAPRPWVHLAMREEDRESTLLRELGRAMASVLSAASQPVQG
ncbi:MAG: LysR family transcriptional regulator [Sandaracinaceae bacterium]